MLALGVHGMSVHHGRHRAELPRRAGRLGTARRGGARPVPQRRRRHRRAGGQDRACSPRPNSSRRSPSCSPAPTRPSSSTRSASPSTATRCWPPSALDSVRTKLLPVATVATPNLDEVAQLTGVRGRATRTGMRRAAAAVLGVRAALGADQGRPSRRATPWTCSPTAPRSTGCARPRHDNRHTHGTGCTLASRGRVGPGEGAWPCRRRCAAAKEYVTGAIAAGFALGGGIGPVDHGWRLRGTRLDGVRSGRREPGVGRGRPDRGHGKKPVHPRWTGFLQQPAGAALRRNVERQRETLPALMHEVQTLSALRRPDRPRHARAGCSGSSDGAYGGASARCCCRSPAPCRRRRSWQPRVTPKTSDALTVNPGMPESVDLI